MNRETLHWDAVERRDRRFDGSFVYAVRSTGVYCRPSCPARRPQRDRVEFFAGAEEAERAGYRPCRRCRPREAAPEAALVQRVCRQIESQPDGPLTLEALGAAAGLSPHHLQKTFKRMLGITPRQYADTLRVQKLKAGLREGREVTEALYEAGYGSSSRLYEGAAQRLGMTPGVYRRGGPGIEIRYTVAACPLGRVLVGATARGVCAVSLGDSEDELERGFRSEFPHAQIRRDDGGLAPWVGAALDRIEGRGCTAELPLDVHATAFQRSVWERLQHIPRGETRSYSAIARAVGRPGAARAVARACGANPVAVVIPCHRAVRADGALGGYRWGLERKRRLLAAEGVRPPSPVK